MYTYKNDRSDNPFKGDYKGGFSFYPLKTEYRVYEHNKKKYYYIVEPEHYRSGYLLLNVIEISKRDYETFEELSDKISLGIRLEELKAEARRLAGKVGGCVE